MPGQNAPSSILTKPVNRVFPNVKYLQNISFAISPLHGYTHYHLTTACHPPLLCHKQGILFYSTIISTISVLSMTNYRPMSQVLRIPRIFINKLQSIRNCNILTSDMLYNLNHTLTKPDRKFHIHRKQKEGFTLKILTLKMTKYIKIAVKYP